MSFSKTKFTEITSENVRDIFDYDGFKLYWKIWPGSNYVKVGGEVGSPDSQGYLRTQPRGKGYKNHRIIWLWVTGSWPQHQIDHKNGIKDDNRFDNLRDVTSQENNKNKHMDKRNKSGTSGVRLHQGPGRFGLAPATLNPSQRIKKLKPSHYARPHKLKMAATPPGMV